MAPIPENRFSQAFDVQQEFIAIKEWMSDPSNLGLTPREIEKRLNRIPPSSLNFLIIGRNRGSIV